MSIAVAQQFAIGALAVIGWAAIITQGYWSIEAYGSKSIPTSIAVVNFLSFFTILTNMLAATVLAASVAPGRSRRPNRLLSSSAQTAVATYMLIVGCVYEFALRRLWNPVGIHFLVDVTLHYVMPAGYLLYWLLLVPKGSLRYSSVAWWTIYPSAYLIYTAVRGHLYGFFPYPFVNFAEIGYKQFNLNVLGLMVVFMGTGLLFVKLDHLLARPSSPFRNFTLEDEV